MNKILIFLILLCSCSCVSKEVSYPDIFPQKDTLRLNKLEHISSDLLGKPRDIFVVDDYFVIRDEIDGCWFTLIRKSDGKLMRHFGVRGRGPDEILYPLNQEPWGRDFYVYDSSREMLHFFSLDSLLKDENNTGIVRSVHLRFTTDKYAKCRQVLLLESGQIIGNCSHPQGHLVLFDSVGVERKAFYPEYPFDKLHEKEDYITKSFAFQYAGIRADNGKFYNVSTTAGHIEIFSMKNDSLYREKNYLYYKPQYKDVSVNKDYGVAFTSGNKGGLFNPELSDSCLYAAYDDLSSPEHTYIAYNYLFQFDLNGLPLRSYYLSSRISRFFIDKKNGFIYAIGADSESLEPCILYASLK